MKPWLAAGALALALLVATLMPLPASAQAPTAMVVASCPGGQAFAVGSPGAVTVDVNGTTCTSGGGGALTGFTPNGNFATIVSAGSSNSVALPNGTTVAFQNVGTTAVSCTIGTGSATATPSQIVIQPGSTKYVVVGANDTGACIDQTGSTTNTVVLAGGSGLGTDSGGGGSGGGLTGNLGNNVDNVAPVTTGNIGANAYTYCFDGTNWQRCQPVNAGTAGVPGTDVITQQPPLGTPVTMQSAAVANGNGTVLPITTYPIAIVDVVCSVACSGGTTINFEGTDSTGTFFAIQGTPLAGGAGVTTATAGGQWIFNTAGLVSIRARISAYSAGTITVTGNQAFGSSASGGGGGAVTQSGVWTVQPGNTANTTAWLMNLGSMGGTAIASGCVSNYGTAPSAVACPSANVFVTNSVPSVTVGATQISPVAVYDSTGMLNGYPAGTLAAPSPSLISVIAPSPYPANTVGPAVPVTSSSGNVAASSAVATLAAAAGKFTFISGFQATGSGATLGSCVNVTVTGVVGGTMTYTFCASAGVLLSDAPLIVPFNPPLQSSAVNTAIVVTMPSLGAGNTNAAVNAQGYQL